MKITRDSITVEYIKSIFFLNKDSGILYWNENRGKNKTFGKKAGSIDKDGYLVTSVLKKRFFNHVIIWAINNGSFPLFEIDHIDGDKTNNIASNLRQVPRSVNMINRCNCSKNTSGIRGVRWVKRENKWAATATKNKIHFFGGVHSDFIEAVASRYALEQCLFLEEYGICSPAMIAIENYLHEKKINNRKYK